MHSQGPECASGGMELGKLHKRYTHVQFSRVIVAWNSHRGAWYMWPWTHGLSNDELKADPLREGRHSPAAHHPVGYREAQVFVCPALHARQVYGVLQGAHLPQHHHRYQLAIVLYGHSYKACTHTRAALLCSLLHPKAFSIVSTCPPLELQQSKGTRKISVLDKYSGMQLLAYPVGPSTKLTPGSLRLRSVGPTTKLTTGS